VNFPHRRDGLWEQKISIDGMSMTQTSQMCTDRAFEEKMAFGSQTDRSKCSVYSMNRQLNGDWAFDSTCAMGEMGASTTHGVVHGDFNSGYTMQADTTVSGASTPQMNRESKMTITATWLGPCKPDQKPGDIIVGGMKMNLMDRMGGASGGG
jgi:hypothetical protein